MMLNSLTSRALDARSTVLCAALLLTLGGCGKEEPPPSAASSRPVKTMVVETPVGSGVRTFPARIDADRKAELSFRVSGKVEELAVKEGDQVTEGQLVARLDPKDYQIVVNDRQATYNNAKKNFDRGKELVGDGFISKTDFDRLEAEFRNASAALEAARQDLAYTALEAPFGGSIAQRHIERFEEVQAKQTIVSLHDLSTLAVKFDIPESLIRSVRRAGEGQNTRREKLLVVARFDNLPGVEVPLTFKELATRADAQTQTFEATFTMEQLEQATLLPGMTATVTVDLSRLVAEEGRFAIPVDAVVGDYKLDPRVWVVDEETMTVAPRSVKVGRMLENRIEVEEGLEPGERVVVAGAPFMVEGMKVTLLPDLEQADPRPGDDRRP